VTQEADASTGGLPHLSRTGVPSAVETLIGVAPQRAWPPSASLSVERCRAAFDQAVSFTIGAEEELMLVQRESGELAHEADRVLPLVDSRFAPELRAAQLEIITPVCVTAADVCRELASSRRALIEKLPAELGVVAAGTHPTTRSWGEITNADRYRQIADEYAFAATRTVVCGLHVHVAVGGADRALAVYNALRSFLPELAALTANSPFFEGTDTGMCSVRPKMNELYPRSGIPPIFKTWEEFVGFVRWGRAGGLFPDSSYFWYEMRPHVSYGTLEIRVADAQTTVEAAAAYVALVQALVAWLADRYDAGDRLPVHETHRIAENAWRAYRHGLRGWLVDLDTAEPQPTRERLAALVNILEPYAARFDVDDKLPTARTMLAGGGADRQRYVAERDGIDALTRWLVEQTEASAADA
jgi:glutamate---cysteine ligase / carboxylate-amine ligase